MTKSWEKSAKDDPLLLASLTSLVVQTRLEVGSILDVDIKTELPVKEQVPILSIHENHMGCFWKLQFELLT